MPVTPEENQKYGEFVVAKAKDLGILDFDPNTIVWHYTNGAGFLGIIQSSTIHATQVSSLNDRTETKYASDLFKVAITKLMEEKKDDPVAYGFLQKVLEYVKDDPVSPTHGSSKFFVTCFSAEEDSLDQWIKYGKPNGYAIGFYARGFVRDPTSTIYKVIYDRQLQEKATKEIAEATLNFFLDGLTGDRLKSPEDWAKDFFLAWDEWVYKLAPLAKDPKWRSEMEFRLVHELKVEDFPKVQFKQRQTMLGRYLVLDTPAWVKRRAALLPIAKVMIGPLGNHPSFTAISARLLLEQMGYMNIPVEVTTVPLQEP
jgi:hypothetical protein